MKFVKNNGVLMNDGTEYQAYGGCMSLHPGGHIVGGFQNTIHDNSKDAPVSFTIPVEHRIEVAEYHIAMWSHYAAQQRRLAVEAKAKKPRKRRK